MKRVPINLKKVIIIALILITIVSVYAQDGGEPEFKGADFIWLVLGAILVFFMQAGFAMVETGFTRAKNSTNILMKNLMDFSAGSLIFFLVGWGLMYGKSIGGIFGFSDFMISDTASASSNAGLYGYASWLFQVVFAATAATIVSGAMAERTKFTSYLIYSVVISGIIYPISGHWIWGGGWLSNIGFVDYAGSTVVHSVGGWAALIGALILGPRIGKYGPDGKPKAIAGHNIPLAALGVFILWFGWFGFNAGSSLAFLDNIGHVAVTTCLAAAAGAVVAMIVIWIINKKPDASMALNGALAGLVGITAPCAFVSPLSAMIIGGIAGIIVVFSVLFFDMVLKIDDPVGAVSVHGICGVWGTLAVGLFAEEQFATAAAFDPFNGVFEGITMLITKGTGEYLAIGFKQLGVQAIGIIAVAAWVIVMSLILFLTLKYTVGLRVTKEEELKGLDIGEHGMEAYSGFQIID